MLLAAVGKAVQHIITSETFTALLLMAVASTMLSTVPVVSSMLGRRASVFARDR